MSSNYKGRTLAIAGILLSILTAGAALAAQAASGPERFTGVVVDMSGGVGHSSAGFSLQIDQYSSVEEINGHLAVLSEQRKPELTFDLSFSTGHANWQGAFADYPVGEERFYSLAWGWKNLPSSVDPIRSPTSEPSQLTKGLFLSGNNHSDDLFMFVRTLLKGLSPNAQYAVTFSVLLESNTAPGLVGVGGAPGEGVTIKVGASTVKPRKVARDGSFYLLNVDKGDQTEGGDNAVPIGDLANPLVDPDQPRYLPKLLNSASPIRVSSNKRGQLWIFVGSDSGFESVTRFYLANVVVTLEEL